jgi:hypothetical protein
MKPQLPRACALILGVVALLFLPSASSAQALRFAPGWGWGLMGSHPQHYIVEPQDADPTAPGTVVTLASRTREAEGFGTYMFQLRVPETHRGMHVRLSVNLRSEDVALWAGLWMRVDGRDRPSIAFDNMVDRPIRGTTEWQRYSVVLDVAEEADRIAYGVLLGGAGKVWIENFTLEIVDRTVPLTGIRQRASAATGGEASASSSGLQQAVSVAESAVMALSSGRVPAPGGSPLNARPFGGTIEPDSNHEI